MRPTWSFQGNHVPTAPTTRFWSKVKKGPNCWQWLACIDSNGYASFGGVRAHTWLAKNVLGWKPTHKMVVDHICRNKQCVRPDHLRLVPQLVNMINSLTPCPTAMCAQRTHCQAGHPYDESNVYLHRGHRYCRACRKGYPRYKRVLT